MASLVLLLEALLEHYSRRININIMDDYNKQKKKNATTATAAEEEEQLNKMGDGLLGDGGGGDLQSWKVSEVFSQLN